MKPNDALHNKPYEILRVKLLLRHRWNQFRNYYVTAQTQCFYSQSFTSVSIGME